ncbi:MAG: LacI family transcriptional regulator [Lachnospiraceae bacterium]|nr:LacI family transcriptional regulator [Lachnospiraceae bacterium]
MASIHDVAKKAGVAISTVSKVLNGYPNISEDTKRKVNLAIDELGFVPNIIASSLSSKHRARVAVLLDPKRNTQAIDQIFMQYLVGVLDRAKETDTDVVTLFFSMFEGKSSAEIIRDLRAQSINGVIIFGLSKNDKTLKEVVDSEVFQCVVIDAPMISEKTSYVSIDHEKAQYDVAKKTVTEDDCKSVLYIAGRRDGYVTDWRIAGIKRLCEEMDLKMTMRYGDFSELASRNIVLKYSKNKDCVVCASDLMAIGAVNALIDLDIFRPVCGFDGVTLMGYVGHQMNTVKQDFYNIGRKAVEEILYLAGGGRGRYVEMPYSIIKMYYKDIIC